MARQMNALMKEDGITATEKEIDNVKAALQHLLHGIITEPLTDFVRDLTTEMGRLSFNWNKFIGKKQTIETTSLAIQRIARGNKTMNDTEMVLKKLLKRAQANLQYKPPAWELSRHYLRSLEGSIEDGKKEADETDDPSGPRKVEYTD